MNKICEYVDIFYGNGDTVISENVEPLAKTWKPIKAVCGNTSPAAVLPFGKISCNPYSGGYSSGYGNNKINISKNADKLFSGQKLIGFSHLNHSGIGALGMYYNYAVTAPFTGDLNNAFDLKDIIGECGSPGYYSATFCKEKIKAEVSVTKNIAVHNYNSNKPFKVAINFANDGLYRSDKSAFSHAEQGEIFLSDKNTVCASAMFQGVKIYFSARFYGNGQLCLWHDLHKSDSEKITDIKNGEDFGCVFEGLDASAQLRLALSLKSFDNAISFLNSETNSFKQIAAKAENEWEDTLGRIEITADKKTKQLFYSNLYHTLVKPSDFSGENYLWDSHNFVTDFCTLWDMYKTQLPLVFTLYKDISEKIVDTIIEYGKKNNKLFHNLVLSADMNIEAKQAVTLASYVLIDAYLRGHSGDCKKILDSVLTDIENYPDFIDSGEMPKTTMLLDITQICGSAAELARNTGDSILADRLEKLYSNWVNAFDEKSGVLKENYDYYEGNNWSYSFRPLKDHKKRMELAGGKDKFIELLDKFFGFACADDTKNRFQGFNNETDMETPYAYIDAGEPEKTMQIIKAGLGCYSLGRNGLPGNNDSGGLSSCYIWNALGVFPVSGQNKMFLSCPSVERAVLKLSNGKNLEIINECNAVSTKSIYFNMQEIKSNTISVTQLMSGGKLYFK